MKIYLRFVLWLKIVEEEGGNKNKQKQKQKQNKTKKQQNNKQIRICFFVAVVV